jgi:hypothetical protein
MSVEVALQARLFKPPDKPLEEPGLISDALPIDLTLNLNFNLGPSPDHYDDDNNAPLSSPLQRVSNLKDDGDTNTAKLVEQEVEAPQGPPFCYGPQHDLESLLWIAVWWLFLTYPSSHQHPIESHAVHLSASTLFAVDTDIINHYTMLTDVAVWTNHVQNLPTPYKKIANTLYDLRIFHAEEATEMNRSILEGETPTLNPQLYTKYLTHFRAAAKTAHDTGCSEVLFYSPDSRKRLSLAQQLLTGSSASGPSSKRRRMIVHSRSQSKGPAS